MFKFTLHLRLILVLTFSCMPFLVSAEEVETDQNAVGIEDVCLYTPPVVAEIEQELLIAETETLPVLEEINAVALIAQPENAPLLEDATLPVNELVLIEKQEVEAILIQAALPQAEQKTIVETSETVLDLSIEGENLENADAYIPTPFMGTVNTVIAGESEIASGFAF